MHTHTHINLHSHVGTYAYIQVKICTLIVANWSTLWSQPQLKGRLLDPLQGVAMRVSQDGVTAELDFRYLFICMCVCLRPCMYMYVSDTISIYTCVPASMHACICIAHVCMYICMQYYLQDLVQCVYPRSCDSEASFQKPFVYMCVCMCPCMHVYVCVYNFISKVWLCACISR